MKDTTLEGIEAQERTLMNIIQAILRFHPQMRNNIISKQQHRRHGPFHLPLQ